MLCVHAKFHLPKSSNPLVIAIKVKGVCRTCAIAMLFYNYPKEIHWKSCLFFEDLCIHKIS